MATVNSGPTSWIGLPPPTGSRGSTRPRAADAAAAFGVTSSETEDQRRARTGVDRGSEGYVSGQVAPSAPAPVAAPPPPAGTFARGFTPQAPAGQVTGGVNTAYNAALGTDTRSSALTTPGVTTQTSALSSPGAAQVSNTGTTQGQSPVPTGSSASPTVWAGKQLGIDLPDPGSNFLKPTQADLSPTINAQNAAFGTAGNLDQERYAYRPGAAAAQDRVQLDTEQADETRVKQQAALEALTAAANGTVPSAAELQMRREAGRNVAATLGQARALGGRSAGGAARAGTLASADILAKNTADAGQLKAQEQANARNQLIAALGGVRGQDTDQAAKNAGLAQEANANNLRSQLEQNELADRHRLQLLQAQLQAMGIGTNAAGATVATSKANADADNKFKGGLLDTVGGAFGL